jgi:ring-1,2-phenylacetyl-CoA epoxidase subunit PaaD
VSRLDEIRRLAASIPDPEMPALTIEDLGILRDVRVDDAGGVVVDITPTYSGCPALEVIREDVERSIRALGYGDVTVRVVLSPAWTTDWMTDEGRRKLHEYGIAPPRARGDGLQLLQLAVLCPVCDSAHTREVSHFGSTQCQAVRTCAECGETFPHFKEH